ncbi:MAG: hypothetical protein ABI599_01520 [Flavobacteriales bacterium]
MTSRLTYLFLLWATTSLSGAAQTTLLSETFDSGVLGPGWTGQGLAAVFTTGSSGLCVGKESWDQSGPFPIGPGPYLFHQIPYDPNATYTIAADLRVNNPLNSTAMANCSLGWLNVIGGGYSFGNSSVASAALTWTSVLSAQDAPLQNNVGSDGQFGILLGMNPSALGAYSFYDNVVVTAYNFTQPAPITLRMRAWLEGPYVQAQNLMRDDLRAVGLIPALDPYQSGLTVAPSVLNVTGNNAIVDWVQLELRINPENPTALAYSSALIQRDGDIVATDGTSAVPFPASPGYYYVAVKHRNHLPVMTSTAYPIVSIPNSLDLASSTSTTYIRSAPYTDVARKTVGGQRLMWAGNVQLDDRLKYTNASNDRDPILTAIGGAVVTNTITGYRREDVNLDGVVKYVGVNNDRDPILVNVGGTTPTSVRIAQVP